MQRLLRVLGFPSSEGKMNPTRQRRNLRGKLSADNLPSSLRFADKSQRGAIDEFNNLVRLLKNAPVRPAGRALLQWSSGKCSNTRRVLRPAGGRQGCPRSEDRPPEGRQTRYAGLGPSVFCRSFAKQLNLVKFWPN